MNLSPCFQHNSNADIFVGQTVYPSMSGLFDLYYRPITGEFVARFGDDPASAMIAESDAASKLKDSHPLYAAMRLHKAQTFLRISRRKLGPLADLI